MVQQRIFDLGTYRNDTRRKRTEGNIWFFKRVSDCRYRISLHIYMYIVCIQTYTRDAALGPSKISARRNDNRLSDNESPLSPPLPSHVLKPTLCHSLSSSNHLFLASFLSLGSDGFETFTHRRTNSSQTASISAKN